MTNSSLITEDEVVDDWCKPWTKWIYFYGHLIPAIAIFIFGFTFNPVALYYFSTSRNFRRSAYSYYFSAIAVFDLVRLNIWFLFFLFDYHVFKLHFYAFECPTQIFSESVASSISAWLTVSLTVERCLAIFRPLQTLTDTRGKRALTVIVCVILASCAVNSLFLQPGFYDKRVYNEANRAIICYYERTSTVNNTHSFLTSDAKQYYTIFIIVVRVAIPFMLILTTNIILFISSRLSAKQFFKSSDILLVRHGDHRQITPMILFSSCTLLLTVSPRYLSQFYVNFFHNSLSCSVTHFAPHLLKTLELSNYSFNVFISIVSGKHGRTELINMLLCRAKTIPTHANPSTTPHSSLLSKSQYLRGTEKTHHTHKPLLSNNDNFH